MKAGELPAERGTQRSLRRSNLSLVLRHVADHGAQSRARIALDTGFNKSTVSSLVGELVELGLLEEKGVLQSGAVGRPALVIDVSGNGVAAVGMELNVDYLAVKVTDLRGGLRHSAVEERTPSAGDPGETLGRLAAMARAALARTAAQGLRPVGVAVGLPGLVDAGSGTLLVAPNLGWIEVPVGEELRRRIGHDGLPVVVDNEANLGALAELTEGAARGAEDLLYVSGEIGVGAGIIIGREVHRGHRGLGGELGHLTVEPDGRPCGCGSRGCLETRAGLGPLLTAAGITTSRAPGSVEAGVRRLVEGARGGDPTTLAALHETGHWLGIGLASAVNLLSPETIVLGSSYAPLTEWLCPAVLEALAERVPAARWGLPTVAASALGPEAAARGAAALLLERVLDDPAIVADDVSAAALAADEARS